jgi:hypothetical protein
LVIQSINQAIPPNLDCLIASLVIEIWPHSVSKSNRQAIENLIKSQETSKSDSNQVYSSIRFLNHSIRGRQIYHIRPFSLCILHPSRATPPQRRDPTLRSLDTPPSSELQPLDFSTCIGKAATCCLMPLFYSPDESLSVVPG